MSNKLRVKRAYVEAVDKHWTQRLLDKNHTSVNSSKVLNSVSDAQRYIKGLPRILKMTDLAGIDEFIETLCFNIEFDGASATEFKQVEFKEFGINGPATYVLVATNVNPNGKVTVCYAHHTINERIMENAVYTNTASDMFLDWLRARSCESLQTMLPPNVAPKLIYE